MLLAAHLHAQAERYDAASADLDAMGDVFPSAVAVLRVRLAMASGAWADAEHALDELRSMPCDESAMVRALIAARRLDEAMDRLARMADEQPAQREDVLLAARLAIELDRPEDARRWLTSLIEADPYDERPYRALLSLRAPEGPLADADALAAIGARLRRDIPSSRIIRWVSTGEAVRLNNNERTWQQLVCLAETDPFDERVMDLLPALIDRTTDGGLLDKAERWLDGFAERHPALDWPVTSLSHLLMATDRPEQARALLEDRLREHPTSTVARALETVVRDGLKLPDEAQRLALARLEHRGRSIDEALELGDLLSRLDRVADIPDVLTIPVWAELTSKQRSRWLLIVARCAYAATQGQRADQADPGPVLQLFDLTVSRGIALTASLHERRLVLMAGWADLAEPDLLAALDLSLASDPPPPPGLYQHVARRLAESSRTPDPIPFLSRATLGYTPPSSELVIEWMGTVARTGGVDDARALVEALVGDARFSDVLDQVIDPPGPDDAARYDRRAEVAYQLAGLFSMFGRDEQAMATWRLALSYDSTHAWAANDLGYFLADRGEQLDEAARLIELAFTALPDDPSVIDSLGWVRYKRGVILDERDETGRVVRAGALTLLRRAAVGDDASAAVLEHLGDALWVVGRHDEAIARWRAASDLAEARVDTLGGQDTVLPAVLRRAKDEADRTRARLEAVDHGKDPPVADHAPPAVEGSGG